MDICWDLWGSSFLSLVKLSPAYLWPQPVISPSYNIPESMRGEPQKGKAVASIWKRAPKSPEVLQITAYHRAVQAQQNLAYSWLPPVRRRAQSWRKSQFKYLGNILMVPWTLWLFYDYFMTIYYTRSREAESVVAYLRWIHSLWSVWQSG